MVLKLSLLRKLKKSYEYKIRHVFAWCPITKLNLRCIIEASLGSHGRPQLYTLRFSLVIRDRAKTCRISYTNRTSKTFNMKEIRLISLECDILGHTTRLRQSIVDAKLTEVLSKNG